MRSKKKLFFIIIMMVSGATADTSIRANPNYLSTGMSWTIDGVPRIKVGDLFAYKKLTIGGMIEVRNEKRFNQEFLPNHNWRGIARIEAWALTQSIAASELSLYVNAQHESAHPTMGIRVSTQNAYDRIYDDLYRRMILNAIGTGVGFSYSSGKNQLAARFDYSFYFLSKNTPELANPDLSMSHGIAIGFNEQYQIGKQVTIMVSVFDRMILEGSTKADGTVYSGNDKSLTNSMVTYPIIAQTNTVVIKSGVSTKIKEINREIGFFCQALYGHPFGFIDSREMRFTLLFGFETSL